ncbi:MAG: hypothetical protein WCC69_09830 [Pirellulales bacterium]
MTTPSPASASVDGSGTSVREPVAELNITDCSAPRPLTCTLENEPDRMPVVVKRLSTSAPLA